MLFGSTAARAHLKQMTDPQMGQAMATSSVELLFACSHSSVLFHRHEQGLEQACGQYSYKAWQRFVEMNSHSEAAIPWSSALLTANWFLAPSNVCLVSVIPSDPVGDHKVLPSGDWTECGDSRPCLWYVSGGFWVLWMFLVAFSSTEVAFVSLWWCWFYEVKSLLE